MGTESDFAEWGKKEEKNPSILLYLVERGVSYDRIVTKEDFIDIDPTLNYGLRDLGISIQKEQTEEAMVVLAWQHRILLGLGWPADDPWGDYPAEIREFVALPAVFDVGIFKPIDKNGKLWDVELVNRYEIEKLYEAIKTKTHDFQDYDFNEFIKWNENHKADSYFEDIKPIPEDNKIQINISRNEIPDDEFEDESDDESEIDLNDSLSHIDDLFHDDTDDFIYGYPDD